MRIISQLFIRSSIDSRDTRPYEYLRMGCSPYFVLTLIALLTFVTMRWWSLSGQNDELESRIRGLQNEILLE